ncbi:hypothetical protein A3Q56_06663 [Intoshia linei]|uniref:CUB domain-containing protein n=1 Tax=Intoshia linei TaxID=1819745 RepID=A0A177AUE3_9BILA|nr:hypothetical protein A3Q56_06663 [Intoshia linei]
MPEYFTQPNQKYIKICKYTFYIPNYQKLELIFDKNVLQLVKDRPNIKFLNFISVNWTNNNTLYYYIRKETIKEMQQTSLINGFRLITNSQNITIVYTSILYEPITIYFNYFKDYKINGQQGNNDKCQFSYNLESLNTRHVVFNSPGYPMKNDWKIECLYYFMVKKHTYKLIYLNFDVFKSIDSDSLFEKNFAVFEIILYTNLNNKSNQHLVIPFYSNTTYENAHYFKGNISNIVVRFVNKSKFNAVFKANMYVFSENQIKECSNKTKNALNLISYELPQKIYKQLNNTTTSKTVKKCKWKYHGTYSNSSVSLLFKNTKISDYKYCKNTKIQINSSKTLTLCSNDVKEIILDTNNFYLSFVSIENQLSRHFQIFITEMLNMEECTQFTCKINERCISNDMVCNKMQNCGTDDNSDENECTEEFSSTALFISIIVLTIFCISICVLIVIRRHRHRKNTKRLSRLFEYNTNEYMNEIQYMAPISNSNTTIFPVKYNTDVCSAARKINLNHKSLSSYDINSKKITLV